MKVIILVLVTLSTLTRCWGPDGHQIVAQLADNMLSDAARPQVQRLMEPNQTLANISTWPDDYSHSDYGYWSGCLHYANVNMSHPLFKFSRDCGYIDGVDHCCVVASITNYTYQLYQNQTNNTVYFYKQYDYTVDEPTPLSFLVHLVADIHQPLHVGYGCDAGGSRSDVYFFGEYHSLHSVWDSSILDRYNDNWWEVMLELQNLIDTSPRLTQIYTLYMDPAAWGDESYNNYVRHVVYDFSPYGTNATTGDPMVYPNASCPFSSTIDLPDDYYYRNINNVKQRLIAGGIRLGTLLNGIFV